MVKTLQEVVSNQTLERIAKRLDVLIRMTFEAQRKGKSEPMTESEFARFLWSLGLTPTEIAKILGKKSATDVAAFLYSKGKRRKK